MKFLIALILSVLSISAFASSLSERQMRAINKAVAEKCFFAGKLTEVKTTVRVDRVDQGVIDYYYSSEFTAVVRIDQGVFDTYHVAVESAFFSGYDHEARDWGMISVESVKCTMI